MMAVRTVGHAAILAVLSLPLAVAPARAQQLDLGYQMLPRWYAGPSPVFPQAQPYYAPPPPPVYPPPPYYPPGVPRYLPSDGGGIAGGTFNPPRY